MVTRGGDTRPDPAAGEVAAGSLGRQATPWRSHPWRGRLAAHFGVASRQSDHPRVDSDRSPHATLCVPLERPHAA
jgi:hypothetical protein